MMKMSATVITLLPLFMIVSGWLLIIFSF
jgi:hypothetical protein